MDQEPPLMDQGLISVLEERKSDTTIDIVAIPGLGADPEGSWVGDKPNSFDWLKKDGLGKQFPTARIMLYGYLSAWQKKFRVRQSLDALTVPLLLHLSERRRGCGKRPIIFICHSFGGIVLANALCMAEKKSEYQDILLCTAGCLFFGTPFKGVELAQLAIYWETIRTHGFKNDTDYTDLLEFVKWKSDGVMLLGSDMRSLVRRMQPEIPTLSIYETRGIDWSKMIQKMAHVKVPQFVGDGLNKLLKKGRTCFVEKESAVLFEADSPNSSNTPNRGCNHSDLVRFASNTNNEYEVIIGQLRTMIKQASGIVNVRYKLRKMVKDKDVTKLRELLEVETNMRRKRETVSETLSAHSFIEDDDDFIEWRDKVSKRCMWITGPAGMGKTAASLAAITELEAKMNADESSNGEPILLAWFFCDDQPDCCNAEDLLKSILLQLVELRPRLAIHALKFVKASRAPARDGDGEKQKDSSKHKVTMTVEQLWQCLMDVISDPLLKTVYIVVNNLHSLDPTNPSTEKFLQLVVNDVASPSDEERNYEGCDRWFFTSSNSLWDRTKYLNQSNEVQLLNLTDSKYEDKIQEARIIYINDRSKSLAEHMGYSPGLAYETRDVMVAKAENGKWMDIVCLRLEAVPSDDRLAILECLDHVPADNLQSLVEDTWQSVFQRLDSLTNAKLKDVLRTLVLVKQDITIPDLQVLTRYSCEELRQLLKQCHPLLQLSGIDERTKVSFEEEELKSGLRKAWAKLLAYPERVPTSTEVERQIARRHGLMALNCLTFFRNELESSKVKSSKKIPSEAGVESMQTIEERGTPGLKEHDSTDSASQASDENEEDKAGGVESVSLDHNNRGTDIENQDGKIDDHTSGNKANDSNNRDFLVLSPWVYPVAWWMYHAEEGGKSAAKSLCQDMADFWTSDSKLRKLWLLAYKYNEFDEDLDPCMLPLHVAAMLGLKHLTNALILEDKQRNVNEKDQNGFTPLHFAASNNQQDTLQLLLGHGATVNVPEGDTSPLHLAALNGHVEVMKTLINHPYNANVNAMCRDFGSVVHAAIRSGVEEALDLLLENDVLVLQGFSDDDNNDNANENTNDAANTNGNTDDANNQGEDEEEEEETPTPLSLAAMVSEKFLLKLLKCSKAKWNPEDLNDALWAACDNGRKESVDTLLTLEYKFDDKWWLRVCMGIAAVQDFWHIVSTILNYRKERDLNCDEIFFLAATTEQDRQQDLERIWEYAKHDIPKTVKDAALYQAVDKEKLKAVTWLLEVCGANPNATSTQPDELDEDLFPEDALDYGNAITAAAFDGNSEIIKVLLAHGASIDNTNGVALQMAAMQGHEDVTRLLLGNGANVNRVVPFELTQQLSQSGGGSLSTALQAACDCGHSAIVKILLDKGANPNLGGGYLTFPIISATRLGNETILEYLLQATPKVDLNVHGGPDDSFPLTNACMHMSGECIEHLLDHGANINAADHEDDQAIHLAVSRNDTDLLNLLLSRGAEVTHSSSQGGTPLNIAIEEGFIECAKIISDVLTSILQGNNSGQPSHSPDTKYLALQNENQKLILRVQEAEEKHSLLLEKYNDLQNHLNQLEGATSQKGLPDIGNNSYNDEVHDTITRDPTRKPSTNQTNGEFHTMQRGLNGGGKAFVELPEQSHDFDQEHHQIPVHSLSQQRMRFGNQRPEEEEQHPRELEGGDEDEDDQRDDRRHNGNDYDIHGGRDDEEDGGRNDESEYGKADEEDGGYDREHNTGYNRGYNGGYNGGHSRGYDAEDDAGDNTGDAEEYGGGYGAEDHEEDNQGYNGRANGEYDDEDNGDYHYGNNRGYSNGDDEDD